MDAEQSLDGTVHFGLTELAKRTSAFTQEFLFPPGALSPIRATTLMFLNVLGCVCRESKATAFHMYSLFFSKLSA